MTFLLQKFNAINRSRTEARARNGLRPTAGGIAFTGRLAACLLLAGFLGVGSAMAQPHVLRMGGGAIMVEIPASDQVHHYLLDTDGDGDFSDEKPSAAGTDPTGRATDATKTNTFLVGSLALVAWDGSANMLMVTPVSTGIFKIATSPMGAEDLTNDDDDVHTNQGTPHEFVVMSLNSPQIVGRNNAASRMPANTVALQLRDKTSVVPDALKDLNTFFTDQNDVFLTYRAQADKVGKTSRMPLPADASASDAKDAEDILSVSTAGAKLTIALTTKAKDGDMTDVWVWATDGAGEYARWQVPVSVGAGSAPYVVSANAPGDMVLREDDIKNTNIDFSTTFMAGAAPEPNPTGVGGGMLEFKVETSDLSAAKVGTAPNVTYIVPSMVATVSGMGTKLNIRPRAPGVITFTATATDKGEMCKLLDGANPEERDVEAVTETSTRTGVAAYCYTEEGSIDSHDDSVMGYVPDDPDEVDNRTPEQKAGDAKEVASRKAQFRFAQSRSHSVTVTVVTKTSPMAEEAIGGREVVADGDAITVDLEDLNGDKPGEPAAFADPTKEGLAYTATPKDPIATITVEGSMMTITPIWRSGTKPTTVTVMATNNLDETSLPSTFTLTVKTATQPVVNMNPAVQAVLAAGIMLNTGDAPLVVQLTNLTNLAEKDAAKHVALFLDPNAAKGDALPGGLLYKMNVEDVVAHLVYVNQSKENDVSTSAMRLVLDPAAATLTVTPTAASFATVTVWGIDRERLMVSATATITVVSCDGVDMSGSCDGVTVGTENEELPTEVSLSQNYPNPFNPQTTIDYALPQAGDVSLIVYDMLGREVDVLLDGPQAAGRHTVRFGANHLPNGTYVYRLVAADKTITRTMVLVK